MSKLAKSGLAMLLAATGALLIFVAVIAFLPWKDSWTYRHTCPATGKELSDEEYFLAALSAEGVQLSILGLPPWPERFKIRATRAEHLRSEFPNCCSVYLGPSGTHFLPPGFVERFYRQIAKVVTVKIPAEQSRIGKEFTLYVPLDACGEYIANN